MSDVGRHTTRQDPVANDKPDPACKHGSDQHNIDERVAQPDALHDEDCHDPKPDDREATRSEGCAVRETSWTVAWSHHSVP